MLRAELSQKHSCDSQWACWKFTKTWKLAEYISKENKAPAWLRFCSDINANISLMASFKNYNIWAVRKVLQIQFRAPYGCGMASERSQHFDLLLWNALLCSFKRWQKNSVKQAVGSRFLALVLSTAVLFSKRWSLHFVPSHSFMKA